MNVATLAGRDQVRWYLDRGYSLAMWSGVGDGKGPRQLDWPSQPKSESDYREGDRVGIILGTEIAEHRFLIDVDIDWGPGSIIAQLLLPQTGFVFGRESKRVSHCFYTTSAALVTVKYVDPVDRSTLIELRCRKQDHTIGFQTMVPPSWWSKDGRREQLVFRSLDLPAHVEPALNLTAPVVHAAIAMVLAKYLGRNGFGHDPRLAVVGFLLREDVASEDVVRIGEAMSSYTNNQEVDDVRRVVESTVKALQTPGKKKVRGAPALAKALGKENGNKIVARIREWLGRAEDAHTIIMRGGELSTIVDQAEEALCERGPAIYQRGGALVRPVVLDKATTESSVRRDAGATVLTAVQEPWLLEQMGLVLSWKKVRADGRLVLADPASIYPRTLLARGQWDFNPLRAVLRAPTLDVDGRTIERPGYDATSGLLLDFAPGSFAPIPERPTRDQAWSALKRLTDPLRGFPFDNDTASAVALSGFLTALIRPALRTAPLHAFDAPTAGTGKSLLAEGIGLVASGTRPPALSQGKTDEEDEKRLATVLFAGDPIIHLDNCERPIQGDFLCSLLTQETVQARILGQSERRIMPSASLVLATGNNLQFAGDVSRRVVVCRLDARSERPDEREFDFDFHAEVLAHRAELVVAALTVLRAYHVAGRPEHLRPMGSFADWDFVRGALVWLGCADPAESRIAVLANDPLRDELARILDLWQAAFGFEWVEVADIHRNPEGNSDVTSLHCALIEASGRHEWSAKSAGRWLGARAGRIVGGRALYKNVQSRKWKLVDQQGDPEGTGGGALSD